MTVDERLARLERRNRTLQGLVLLLIGLLGGILLGAGVVRPVPEAHAGGAGVTSKDDVNVYTSSQDGKTVHMWRVTNGGRTIEHDRTAQTR